MTRDELLEVIADILECEMEDVKEDAVLEDFETWDSVAVLATISFISEQTGKFLHANEIKQLKTIADLMKAMEAC